MRPRRHFLPLAMAALLLRLLIGPWPAHAGDMAAFWAWGRRLAEVGFGQFFANNYWCDYLPGYLYILWPLGMIANLLPAGGHVLLFKLPNILADLATAYLLWRMARPCRQAGKLWLPALYLFNPAVLINSTLWGQVDSFHALCLFGGLGLLCRRRFEWAAMVLGYAVAVKIHALVILPLAALHALMTRCPWHRLVLCVILAGAVFLAAFLPFNAWSLPTLPAFVHQRLNTTLGQYHFATINALNLWYLLERNFERDDVPLLGPFTAGQIGAALFAAAYAAALFQYWRRRATGEQALWQASAIIFLATFLFVTRAHERHLFPFFAVTAAACVFQSTVLLPYAVLSITYSLNMIYAWLWLKPAFATRDICHPAVAWLLCSINLLSLPLLWAAFSDFASPWLQKGKVLLARGAAVQLDPDPAWIKSSRFRLLAVILIFAFTLRVFRLNEPPERYHDEVYHAYTAEQWVGGNTDAWLWNTRVRDRGCAYEWTHPPLAKLMMAKSMQLFGLRPWAWRLPAALLGTAGAALIFLIARKIFERDGLALLAAAFYSLDALPLALSRVGMNDIYSLFFVLAAILCALHNRYLLAALAAGCALASKWSALCALPLLGLIHLWSAPPEKSWKPGRLAACSAAYAFFLPAVYLAAYVPFFRADFTWGQFTELQKQMWYYHTGLKAKHPFSSPAWRWPINAGTMWIYMHNYPAASASTASGQANIYLLGNPVIWLTGLAAMIYLAIQTVRHRAPRLAIILAGYLLVWAPWLASPRIMFINHYLPALPFLYIALAWTFTHRKIGRYGTAAFLILAAAVLAVMYPYLTAWPLPKPFTPAGWS